MRRIVFTIAALSIVACRDAASPDVVAQASIPVLAKGEGAVDSRAQWLFHRRLSDGITPTKLYGDGRGLDGTPVTDAANDPSSYDGEAQCGVRATIAWYASPSRSTGNAFFAPQGGSSMTCQGTPRTLTVDTGAVALVHVKWTTTVPEVMHMAVGSAKLVDVTLSPNVVIPNCAQLRYAASVVGSGVLVRRTAGDMNRGPGSWTLESQGTHLAGCYNFGAGNKLVHTGPDYVLPFRVTINEVLR